MGVVVAGEMKVLDDDGDECPPGVVGEIYMRPAPGSAPTYRYVGATAKSRDGWDSLGDLGLLRRRRASSTSPTAASTCSPSAAATSTRPRSRPRSPSTRMSCPAWSSASRTTISARCPTRWCRRDRRSTRRRCVAFLAERLAGYKVPRTVEFVDRPLRDDAGKARRSAVRDEVIARAAQSS